MQWGFCIPPADQERIIAQDAWEADAFAAAVLEAEGMVPEYEKKWRRRIASKFIEQFGSSSVVRLRGEDVGMEK